MDPINKECALELVHWQDPSGQGQVNRMGEEKATPDKRLFKRFVEMLSGGALTLEIKQTRQPNHGKLYLFHPEDPAQPKTYVLGSSNFSKQGLKERHELNLRVEQDPTRAEQLANLFEDLPPSDRRPDNVYLDEVAKSSIYLGIFGNGGEE